MCTTKIKKRQSLLYRKRIASYILPALFSCMLFCGAGCSSPAVPKPEGYPRLTFPPYSYRLLDTTVPYTCEIPVFAKFVKRPDGIGHDLQFPGYRAQIHLTYYHKPNALDTLYEDARTMAYKHAIRADEITERLYENPEHHVYALMYRIEGNVASAIQFYATDSVQNFLRGALYFFVEPNADSLAPAVDYFSKDIEHMLETLKWKE